MCVSRGGRKRWDHAPREGGGVASSEVKSKEQEQDKKKEILYNSYRIVVV
jgi:hypothetical protein